MKEEKMRRRLAALKEAAAGREAYAVRNLGMDNAFMGRLEDIPEDDFDRVAAEFDRRMDEPV